MVTKVSSTVGIAMIWLAVVAGVSATAWFAIDRAGRNLTGGSVSELLPKAVGTAVATTTPRSSPSATTASGPTASGTKGSGATESVNQRDRSISVAGGLVSVRCTGATILLRIAQPDNGWRVEVKDPGPDEVEARFENGDDESERETRVQAVCANGAPDFTVENH